MPPSEPHAPPLPNILSEPGPWPKTQSPSVSRAVSQFKEDQSLAGYDNSAFDRWTTITAKPGLRSKNATTASTRRCSALRRLGDAITASSIRSKPSHDRPRFARLVALYLLSGRRPAQESRRDLGSSMSIHGEANRDISNRSTRYGNWTGSAAGGMRHAANRKGNDCARLPAGACAWSDCPDFFFWNAFSLTFVCTRSRTAAPGMILGSSWGCLCGVAVRRPRGDQEEGGGALRHQVM